MKKTKTISIFISILMFSVCVFGNLNAFAREKFTVVDFTDQVSDQYGFTISDPEMRKTLKRYVCENTEFLPTDQNTLFCTYVEEPIYEAFIYEDYVAKVSPIYLWTPGVMGNYMSAHLYSEHFASVEYFMGLTNVPNFTHYDMFRTWPKTAKTVMTYYTPMDFTFDGLNYVHTNLYYYHVAIAKTGVRGVLYYTTPCEVNSEPHRVYYENGQYYTDIYDRDDNHVTGLFLDADSLSNMFYKFRFSELTEDGSDITVTQETTRFYMEVVDKSGQTLVVDNNNTHSAVRAERTRITQNTVKKNPDLYYGDYTTKFVSPVYTDTFDVVEDYEYIDRVQKETSTYQIDIFWDGSAAVYRISDVPKNVTIHREVIPTYSDTMYTVTNDGTKCTHEFDLSSVKYDVDTGRLCAYENGYKAVFPKTVTITMGDRAYDVNLIHPCMGKTSVQYNKIVPVVATSSITTHTTTTTTVTTSTTIPVTTVPQTTTSSLTTETAKTTTITTATTEREYPAYTTTMYAYPIDYKKQYEEIVSDYVAMEIEYRMLLRKLEKGAQVVKVESYDRGDADLDGDVDLRDAGLVLKYYTYNSVAKIDTAWDDIIESN